MNAEARRQLDSASLNLGGIKLALQNAILPLLRVMDAAIETWPPEVRQEAAPELDQLYRLFEAALAEHKANRGGR